jgi:hypothetical protein
MKTAKKVLSVVLSVLLIVSTVAVAASALVDATNERATYTLKAEVLSANGAQEALNNGAEDEVKANNFWRGKIAQETADVNAYKALASHTYATAGASASNPIEVEPGQIVWVTMSLTSNENFFAGAFQYRAYYSKAMFLSTGCTADAAVIKNASCPLWNYQANWTANVFARFNQDGRTDFAAYENDAYHGYVFVYAPNLATIDSMYEGYAPAVNGDLVTFPIYVRPDAEAGSTGVIMMDPDDGYSQTQSFVAADTYEEPALLKGSPYISANTLYFKVKGDEPAVDYTRLNAAIAAYEALDASAYTDESFANATAKYNDAKAALTSTDQDAVTAAAIALEDAIAALEEAVVLDYTRIDAAIASVPANLSAYTTSTANAAASAKTAAQTAKANATTQAELDNAAATLEAAVAALKLKADLTDLNDALAQAAAVNASNYTADSIAALNQAVAAGQALVANADEVYDTADVTAKTQAIIDAIANLVPLGADYSAVDTAIARYNALDKSLYTTASKNAVEAAIADVVEGLPITEQATVDAYAAAINNAIDALVKLANTTELRAAVAAANAADSADYSADTWNAIQGYVSDANAYIGAGVEATEDQQANIDTLTAALNAALASTLGAADYTAVEAAIASIPADLSIYTDASVANLNAAVDGVVYGLKADKQDIVNGYAAAINDAIAALTEKAANLADLIQAIAAGEGYNADLYTADSFAALTDAIAAGKTLKDSQPGITQQGAVDDAAAAINTAIANLVPLGADFSALKAQLDAADALDRDLYTADSLAAFDAAIAPAYEMYANAAQYTKADQPTIDAMAQTAEAAFALLVKAPADYTAVEEAQARAATYNSSYYPADQWAAVEAALAAVETGKTKDQQAEVDAMAAAINEALDALVMNDADYTFVDRWSQRAAGLTETDYTADSWANLEEALAAVETGLKADRQADVDAMADAIYAAINALVQAGSADYSEVDALIAQFEDMDTSIYTADSVAAVEEAIDDVVRGLNENFQDQVDAMADAIRDAIAGLTEITYGPADYSAVEAAIASVPADLTVYTDESVANLQAAINAVVYGLDEREQETVNGFANAINAAIAALELKVIPEPKGKILSVDYTQSASTQKTYTLKIEGRATGFRFYKKTTDATTTIYRNSDYITSIVSYNANDEVVSGLSKDIAYEIWTVELKLQPADYFVIAQTQYSASGWESKDLGYDITVSLTTSDKAVISVNAPETVKSGEKAALTVVTGKDVLKIQILVDGAETGPATFDLASYGVAGEDNNTFNVTTKALRRGEHSIKVRIRTAAGWEVSDYDAVTIVAE